MSSNHPRRWPFLWAATAAIASAASLLAACGGGAADAPDSAAQAEAYSLGPIEGFGSVIVGGVRFDDSTASVTDEDGNAFDRSALKLGMMVQIDAAAVDRAASAALARRIRFGPEVVGPVSAVNAGASTMTVLGQTVLVTSSTLFDDSLAGGLPAVQVGDIVQVNGILDTGGGRIVATRIDERPAAPAYFLRGVVAALDSGAKTLRIGSELISFADLPGVPAALANDSIVRVVLRTTQVGGAWVAVRLAMGPRLPDAVPHAHIHGIVTAFTSATSFLVNGLPVDASNATFPDGQAGIVRGARVEVEGRVVGGVLVATQVEIDSRRLGEIFKRLFELHGELSGIDTTAKTFALRGLTVWYGGTVEYRNGTEADLSNGDRVAIRGKLSADRTRLEASRIEFK